MIAPRPGKGFRSLLLAAALALATPTAADEAPPTPSLETAMRLVDALALYTEGLPKDSFDRAAILSETGSAVEAIFAWVRDRTALVPYAGRLRGAGGVLADRRGNALDRALLLASLLQESGHEVRIVRGRLDAAAAERLLAAWQGGAGREPRSLSEAEAQRLLIDALAAQGFPTDWMPAWLAEQARLRSAAAEQLQQESAELARDLLALAGPLLQPDAAADRQDRLAGLADHWWVQVRLGQAWLDLDPAAPDAQPGATLAAAMESYGLDALPAGIEHGVTFRVVAERLDSGGLEQLPLLEQRVVAGDEPTASFRLAFLPMGSAFAESPPKADSQAEDSVAAALVEREWLPVLFVDGELVIWRFADIDGAVFDTQDMALDATRLGQSIARMTGEGLGSAIDLLGGLPGGDPAPADEAMPALSAEHALTALWLEIEVQSPGRPARLERRMVFDLLQGLPPAERGAAALVLDEQAHRSRALGLLTSFDGIIAFAAPGDLYLAAAAGRHWLGQRKELRAAFRAAGKDDLDALMAAVGALDPWPATPYLFAQLRQGLGSGIGGYFDAPLVVTEFRALTDSADGTLLATAGFDILARPTGEHAEGAEAARRRLAQGVLDTLLEARLLGAEAEARNAALLSLSTGLEGWRALPPSATGDDLLIVPNETAEGVGVWWRIDPRTGETLGVDAAGRGSVVFEYVMTKFNVTREAMVQYRLIGCVVAAKAASVSMLIGLLQDRPSTGSPLEVTRDPIYQITRGTAKQAACFFSALTFGSGPGLGLYGAGAMVGLASLLESVGSFGVARYLDASGD